MAGFFRAIGGGLSGVARPNRYTLQDYPRLIEPEAPDFARCVPEFGRELTKRDCKEAVKNMPWARENAEVEWAVNFHVTEYNLPMSIGWEIPRGEAGAGTPGMYIYSSLSQGTWANFFQGNCVISIEVAGPQAFYEPTSTHTPFTIRASPFQLRGLAAYVVNDCVQRGGNVGGFATNKISNLANYLQSPSTDLSAPFRKAVQITPLVVSETDFELDTVQQYPLTS